MTELSKEGAGRPLCESAPKIAPKPLAKAYLWGAAASYPLVYFYTRRILFFAGELGWEILLFALLFVAGVEAMARALHRKASPETPLWAGCWLVLSCVMPLWGVQPALTGWQVVVWHLFAIWFVLARCGMLAQGYTGSLCFLDGLMGGVVLPFGNFFRRIAAVGAGLHALAQHRVKLRQTAVAVGTVLLTLLLCGTAWQLLAAADANFAALGQGLDRWLDELLNSYRFVETFIYFLLSLPVGAWLYGLVAGSLHRETPPCTGERFFALLQPVRVLPAVTANVVVGALSLIYTLFFALPFEETYCEDNKLRAAYTEGMYGVCRHPGVLWFAGAYLCMWGMFGGWKQGIYFLLMIFWNYLYIIFQDLWTFPQTFFNYREYQKNTPFLIPNKESIQACFYSVRKQ